MDESSELDTKEIRIALDLAHFGELVAAVIKRFADVTGVDAPTDDDEWREVMRHAWDYCVFMADRVQMAKTSLDDLDALPTYEPPTEKHVPGRDCAWSPCNVCGHTASRPSPFDRPLDTRRLSDRERAARRPSE